MTRQQVVTMLWRWHGESESDHSVGHHIEAHTISAYADEAVAWTVENGIKGGYPDGMRNSVKCMKGKKENLRHLI